MVQHLSPVLFFSLLLPSVQLCPPKLVASLNCEVYPAPTSRSFGARKFSGRIEKHHIAKGDLHFRACIYGPSLDLPFSWSGERHSQAHQWKTLILFFLVLAIIPSAFAQSATVNWNTTHQTIDGFAGATIGSRQPDGNYRQNSSLFFSPTSGIGLSYIRQLEHL